jgi:hypothetical protein
LHAARDFAQSRKEAAQRLEMWNFLSRSRRKNKFFRKTSLRSTEKIHNKIRTQKV